MGRYDTNHLPISAITNEFAYNRFALGPFGLRAEMGAMATITLPAASGADTGSLRNAVTLQLRSVNSNRFSVTVRPKCIVAKELRGLRRGPRPVVRSGKLARWPPLTP